MFGKLTTLVLVLGLVGVALACNGYKTKIIKMESDPDGIVTAAPDFTIDLNKKCELVPSGCVSNKAFNTAQANFTLKKDNMVLKEGVVDLCDMADGANNEIKGFMKVFSLPEKCPVEEEKICANEHKIDMSKYKNMLSMAKGTFDLEAEILHDTGRSHFHLQLQISK